MATTERRQRRIAHLKTPSGQWPARSNDTRLPYRNRKDSIADDVEVMQKA